MPVVDDGKDALFGDVGNDWLVGGTNEDHLWGGYGDDLLNGNDNHDSTLGTADPLANNTTNGRDIGPTFVDFVFGIAANAPSATIPVTVQGMTFGPTSQPAITPASSRG